MRRRGLLGLGGELDLAAQFQSLCVEIERGTLALLDRNSQPAAQPDAARLRAWRGRAVVGRDGIEPPTANASVSAAHQCARAGRDVRCSVATAYLMRYSVSVPIGVALLARKGYRGLIPQ